MSLARKAALAIGIIALLGFADAAYLTYAHYSHIIPPCTIVNGCETVTTSAYSMIFGVPVALLGAIYYLVMFLGAVYCFEQQDEKMLERLSWTTWVGLLASAWFVSLQFFVIHALCIYCLSSAVTSTGLFVAGMIYLRKRHIAQPT